MPFRTSLLLMVACLVALLGMSLPSSPCHAQWQETTFHAGMVRQIESGKFLLMEYVYQWETRTQANQIKKPVWEVKEMVDPITKATKKVATVRYVHETRQVPIQVCVLEESVRELTIQQHTFRNLDGTLLEPDSLSQRIKQQPVVLVTTNGKPLPKFYVPLFQADTLVMVTSPQAPLSPVTPYPHTSDHQFQTPPPNTPQQARQVDSTDAQAAPDLQWPAAFPPTFRLARLDKQNRMALRSIHSEMSSVMAYVPSENNREDASNWQAINLKQRRTTSRSILIPNGLIKAQTVSGKPFNKQQQTILRQNNTPVVLSTDGKPVAESWLTIIKPDGLVVRAPLPNAPTGKPNQWINDPYRESP